MILILSTSELETSTDEVIVWLKKFNADFIRLNGDDIIDSFHFKFIDFKPVFYVEDKINDRIISSEEITTVWYRRKINKVYDAVCNLVPNNINEFRSILGINTYHYNEMLSFYEIIEFTLKNVVWINKPMQRYNKLDVLNRAIKYGIKVPQSFIQNTAPLPVEKFITKPTTEVRVFNDDFNYYSMYTSEPKLKKEVFFPSLFQEKIEKEYEVRSFYLDGDFYSIAIFSQQNSKTKIDYRNIFYGSDDEHSFYNNCIYKLPEDIEQKLKKLMIDLDMKSGSIDLIRGIDGEYYFLEINPVGQFGNVSDVGKFNLEKIIAEKLCFYDERKE
ncbi:grasp-with-spasm system ATP-grasp peptide maturase [uncultured Tenacibaculum sp.]|uniref:grasp-with-spasm system ATP-grasp peptide maturase n=1 Tax=uncultured Tenacibaculum sp. TaxID=174713 RepID=UPI00261CD259|nr:grasp-with-spasm system ATP-grasp peptide maturase [uncultured Tenacibaculum sp.]